MFSQATTMQEEHGECIAIKELHKLNPGDDMIPKVRKPYTISKQRERWTEEEHEKFLEALKLHGRAWRKIEEHVGTKTTVQIRSHAQKFFYKITRESGEESTLKPIEIPPPRPKKKPAHPYPRKIVTLIKPTINAIPGKLTRSLSTNTSASDNENQSSSPTSVLSVIGSNNAANSSPDEQTLELLPSNNNALARECSNESNWQFLKLFGKTLIVKGPQMSECNNNNMAFPTRSVPIRFPIEKLNESSDLLNEERSSNGVESYGEFKGQVKNLISSYRVSKRVSADSLKGFVPYKRFQQDCASSSNRLCS